MIADLNWSISPSDFMNWAAFLIKSQISSTTTKRKTIMILFKAKTKTPFHAKGSSLYVHNLRLDYRGVLLGRQK